MEAVFALMSTETFKACSHIGDSVKVDKHSSRHTRQKHEARTALSAREEGILHTAAL